MKDEIKEILDKCTPYLFGDEVDKLTNYITNLREENKFAKEYEKQYRIEKSRNEKAIEYLKSPRWKIDTHIEFNKQHLLNILKGENNDV